MTQKVVLCTVLGLKNVRSMNFMFSQSKLFNSDISRWNTARVTATQAMFSEAESFNIDISRWNVNQITRMWMMFSGAKEFKQCLNWCLRWGVEALAMFSQGNGGIEVNSCSKYSGDEAPLMMPFEYVCFSGSAPDFASSNARLALSFGVELNLFAIVIVGILLIFK